MDPNVTLASLLRAVLQLDGALSDPQNIDQATVVSGARDVVALVKGLDLFLRFTGDMPDRWNPNRPITLKENI